MNGIRAIGDLTVLWYTIGTVIDDDLHVVRRGTTLGRQDCGRHGDSCVIPLAVSDIPISLESTHIARTPLHMDYSARGVYTEVRSIADQQYADTNDGCGKS